MVLQPPVQGLVGNILSEGKNGLSHLENTILKYETSISKGITVLPFTKPASFPVGHHYLVCLHILATKYECWIQVATALTCVGRKGAWLLDG